MSTSLIIVIFFIAAILLFLALQWHSDKTYKPSKKEIISIIKESINGNISLHEFDTFSNVRIAYNKDFEKIRDKYNKIISNDKYINNNATEEDVTSLNADGKTQLKHLLNELCQ